MVALQLDDATCGVAVTVSEHSSPECGATGFDLVVNPGGQIPLVVTPTSNYTVNGIRPLEFAVTLTLSGLEPHQPQPIETVGWGAVKSRYR